MFTDINEMDELIKAFPKWQRAINENEPLSKIKFKSELVDFPPPSKRIERVEIKTVKAIIESTLDAHPNNNREFSNMWVEKIRRYCEINRPNLKSVSLKRFGRKDVQQNLEFMTIILSIAAYHNKNILLFNALGTIFDFLDRSPFSKEWKQPTIKYIAEAVLSKPDLFIGKEND